MESFLKRKNVGRGEAVFRSVIGGILIILAFVFSGSLRWVFGVIGLAFILTSIFGH
jgi:hypothetical protein